MEVQWIDEVTLLDKLPQYSYFMWGGEFYMRLTPTNEYIKYTEEEIEEMGEEVTWIKCFCFSNNSTSNLGHDYEVFFINKDRVRVHCTHTG